MKKKATAEAREEQTVKVQKGGGGYYYLAGYVEGRKLSRVEYGDFVLTYDPDHDTRYAHIPPEERWEYPDEIIRRGSRYKREKTCAELSGEIEMDLALRLFGRENWGERYEKSFGKPLPDRIAIDYTARLLLAKDVPVTRAWRHIFWVH